MDFVDVQYSVVRILKECPECRGSDDKLVEEWARRFTGHEFSFKSVGLSMSRIKSIERCRRKVQAKNPSLKDVNAEVQRELREAEYRSYFGDRL